ncbi:uncharacterized protein PV09_06200 [Verruconis gallopava]|uniref:Alpha/beta hydrolase fold-3 domain-containing protein n=1 Tax=Verruconis gallopava TaxID=253628 RepID=A0A0D2ATA3_9PEZI|nr:uncharacterized protein PV09_06200 [Verruconis gallopava]KIW02379.1 hypothetical protein PV09_06200 [Verruconis gallopava]
MILDQISYLDCIIFLIFLTPQLILHVGLLKTSFWLVGALPHIAIKIPYQFIHERFFMPFDQRTPFVQRATPFQDLVIRYVRFAFAHMPSFIGRVFFSKPVSLPFLRWRMLRHGYLRSPIPWREINHQKFTGVWIVPDESREPDVVVYYCHGGGFSMGSSYFYMEFLIAWVALLKAAGFSNPALLALEYTLVPDAVYPKQIQETYFGYKYLLSIVEDPSRICVAGDSAGGTLILSLLLYLSESELRNQLPALACMISPWVTLISEKNRNTPSDYLDASSLRLYGSQYIGTKVSPEDPMVSPGNCKDVHRWARASPLKGWSFQLGSEEVLGPETYDLIDVLRKAGQQVHVSEEEGGIHAWPVALLYLGESRDERLHGLADIVGIMVKRMQ